MTVNDLFEILEKTIHDGHGNATIYFDTEARKFEYHMAKVGSAYVEDSGFTGEVYVNLQESKV